MGGSTQPLLQRIRARSRAQQRALGVVCLLVFALIGAPASNALRHECDLCPRTCPMHLARDHHGGAGHMGCHGVAAAPGHDHGSTAPPHGVSVTRASCGNHAILPATVLPPMILPTVQLVAVATTVNKAPQLITAHCGRSADPPDTPPPIDAA
jgi:hypothetical protein